MKTVLFAVSLIFPLAGFGADVSGIWTGQVTARNGSMQDVRFKFIQDRDTLTGKMYGEDESTPIRDGKIAGDQITFSITNELNGGNTTFLFSGTIVGNEIQLTRERQRTGNEANDPNRPERRNFKQSFTLKRLT